MFHRSLSLALLLGLARCSSSTPASDAGVVDAAIDSSPADVQTKDVVEEQACAPPEGATCPTTKGNCKNIGDPCTKGGGQCPSPTACDLDLDPTSGAGICITFFACTPNNHDCGAGATCCNTTMTSNTPVCLPNQCIPSDCTAEQ